MSRCKSAEINNGEAVIRQECIITAFITEKNVTSEQQRNREETEKSILKKW